jgi:hypothetical protein
MVVNSRGKKFYNIFYWTTTVVLNMFEFLQLSKTFQGSRAGSIDIENPK